MTIGQNIARLRERRGLSQVELADRLGMRQPSVWKLEQAKNVKVLTLLKVAKALAASVEEMLADVDPEYAAQRQSIADSLAGVGAPHAAERPALSLDVDPPESASDQALDTADPNAKIAQIQAALLEITDALNELRDTRESVAVARGRGRTVSEGDRQVRPRPRGKGTPKSATR